MTQQTLHASLLTGGFVSWSIVTQTCINTGKRLDFLLPKRAPAYSKRVKQPRRGFVDVVVSTFVAMSCSGKQPRFFLID